MLGNDTSTSHIKYQPEQSDIYELKEDEIFLHEDLYLQVEIVPCENSDDLITENDEIKEFSKEHSDGVGFTDVYVRDDQKITTASRNISLEEFEKILLDCGLTKLESVYSGYGQYKEKCIDTCAYKIEDAVIYCDFDNGLVKNIWIDGFRFNSKAEHKDKMISSLNSIGKRWDLILNDWDLSETIDLESKEQIRNYISENQLVKTSVRE